MGGHTDGEATDGPGQLDELDGVQELTGASRGVGGGVTAQGHEVLHARLAEGHQDLGELQSGVGDAHEVGHGGQRGGAQHARHQVVGTLARLPAAAVGHRDERRRQGFELAQGPDQGGLLGVVLGREELERVRGTALEHLRDQGHDQVILVPGRFLVPGREWGATCYPLRSAARTALRRSMARVMGPTPPRRGVIHPATSATDSSTSERTLRPSHVVPAPTTAAPGFTMSGVTSPGEPAAATTMSARRTWSARSGTAGVDHGDSGVAARALQRQQQRQGSADGDATTDHHDVPSLHGHVVGVEELDDARRCARQRPRRAHHQTPQVQRVQAVDVLGVVHGQQRGLLVEALGQRDLDQVGMDGGIGVEATDNGLELVLAGLHGQMLVHRDDAHLSAVVVLQRHVALTGGVVAHEDGAQPGLDALGCQTPPRGR